MRDMQQGVLPVQVPVDGPIRTVGEPPLFSLLITTKNRKDDLLQTLRVMSPVLLPEHEIIVMDDGSSDGTADAVANEFPFIKLIRNRDSIGLIAARNKLLNLAKGVYAISIDDDSEIITPGFLSGIRNHFEHHPRCGVIALRIYWGKHFPETGGYRKEPFKKVSEFVGCGHVWRMEAWRSIPSYPAWFEFYGEENYASLQLHRHGWEIHYCPDIYVHHRVDMSGRKAERRWRYRRQFRSGLYLMLLFYPLRALPRRMLYVIGIQVYRRVVKQKDYRSLLDLLWTFKEVLKNSPKILTSRSPLTPTQWASWNNLSPAEIYWSPKPD